jgi:hypothetical protein
MWTVVDTMLRVRGTNDPRGFLSTIAGCFQAHATLSICFSEWRLRMHSTELGAPSLDSVMAYQHPQLLTRLEERIGLDIAVARQLFEETKRFLYLCATSDSPMAPTARIDEVWHNFMLYSEDYTQFCESQFGFVIHHRPWSNAEVAASDWSIVHRTRRRAEDVFGPDLSSDWDYAVHPASCGTGN